MAWPFTRRNGRRDALTASVTEIPLDKGRLVPYRSKDAGWQTEAWLFFHVLGEVRFCARYMGNTLARVRFFVGTRDHPGDPVVPIPDDTKTKADLAVRDLLERIKGRDGTFESLVRVYGVQQFVAGESFLVGETGLEGETWEFLSTSELRRAAKNAAAGMNPTGDGPIYERDKDGHGAYTAIGDESLVLRFWTRDAEFRERADSPMRTVLDICQSLQTAQAMQTAGDLSRLATAGLFFVPAEADLPKAPVTDTPGHPRQPPRLMLMDSLHAAMKAAMEDPSSVAAIAPILVEAKADFIEKFKRLTFEREVDKTIVARIDHLIRRLAQGLDLPPEKLLGIGDMNHWSAWNVSEETVSAHISPMASAFCEDLTVGFLAPTLEALGDVQDPERYAIGFDVTDLIVSPDRAQHAMWLYEHFELGADHLLEALGFDPAVRPDVEELLLRIALARAANVANPDPSPDLAVIEGKKRPAAPALPAAPTQPEPAVDPNAPPPEEKAQDPNADKVKTNGEKKPKPGDQAPPEDNPKAANPRNAKKNGKTAQAKKQPPAKAAQIDRMVTAIDFAVDQALLNGNDSAINSPESWRRLRDELSRIGYLDLEMSERLIEGVMLLARNKRLNRGMDVLGAATILCEAAVFDEDDLDLDDIVPV